MAAWSYYCLSEWRRRKRYKSVSVRSISLRISHADRMDELETLNSECSYHMQNEISDRVRVAEVGGPLAEWDG